MKKLSLLITSALVASSFSGSVMAEKKMLLKTPIYYNSVLPSLGSTIKYVSDNIQTLSGDSLKMKIYDYTKDIKFKDCKNMGEILKSALGFLVHNYENVNPLKF